MIDNGQMKAARALLGLKQEDLADATGLSVQTIKRMEIMGTGKSSLENVLKVKAALEKAGVQFIPENGGGAGVRLAKPKRAAETDVQETIQYPEFKDGDGGPGSGG